MKHRSRSIAAAVAVALLSIPSLMSEAVAETVPFTTSLVFANNPDETGYQVDTHSSPATATSESYSKSGDWGSVGAFASADLSTGQLKVRALNAPNTGYSPYVQTNAWFGDGFRTRDSSGAPFQWLPNTGAQFTLDLTGNSVSSSGAIADLGFGQVGAFVVLSLFEPGTLSASSKLVGDEHGMGYYLYLLGNPNLNLLYTDWEGGQHPMAPTAYYGDLSGDIHIRQDFQPNGDFDWAVVLGVAGQLSGPEFYDLDLSHTLTVGYVGPSGSVTTSVSGLFTNIQAVPEPGAMALLSMGLVGLLAGRGWSAARGRD